MKKEDKCRNIKNITTIGSMRQVCCSMGKRDHWMNHDARHRLWAPKTKKKEPNQTKMRHIRVGANESTAKSRSSHTETEWKWF